MSIPMFLAATPGEIRYFHHFPNPMAWMSVHFSMSGRGLSNMPGQIPTGSLIILDDANPLHGHDPEQICRELTMLLTGQNACGLLLDFERPPEPRSQFLAELLCRCCKELGKAFGAPADYVRDEYAATFLPPLPCHTPPEELPLPQGKLWLDATPSAWEVTVSRDVPKARQIEYTAPQPGKASYYCQPLSCMCCTERLEDTLRITLYRTPACAVRLLGRLNPRRVTLAVGLWRDYRVRG